MRGDGRLGKVVGCSDGIVGGTGEGWWEAWEGGGRPGRTDGRLVGISATCWRADGRPGMTDGRFRWTGGRLE